MNNPTVRARSARFRRGVWRCWLCLAAAAWIAVSSAADPAPAGSAAGKQLASREEELATQFRELERTFLRLADLLAANDPRRSAVLRSVFEQARDQEVGDRLDTIVKLLEQGQLLKAGTSQASAIDKLRELLDLLEAGDTDRRLSNTKEEVKQFLARLSKAIARQRDIEGSTESGTAGDKLAERQEKLAEDTQALGRDLGAFAKRMESRDPASERETPAGERGSGEQESKPSSPAPSGDKSGRPGEQGEAGEEPAAGPSGEGESQKPAGQEEKQIEGDDESSRARRTKQRLEAAAKRMEKAREQLEEAQRRAARDEQEKAIEELETARAELEEILRQMREQEVERLLVQLETRIRAMLRAEKAVLAGAEKLAAENQSQAAAPDLGRERQLEATRLGREQTALGNDAAKALVLVRDDGSAVAIPEALEQVRDDSSQAAARLARGDVGGTTRGVLQDLVANLEEMLAALEKAQREQQARQQGGAGGRSAEPGEQPLVDKLSELKMIRSLQLRVNTRTQRFSQLLTDGVEQAEEPELLDALDRLSERQRKIEGAARDIVTGRTE